MTSQPSKVWILACHSYFCGPKQTLRRQPWSHLESHAGAYYNGASRIFLSLFTSFGTLTTGLSLFFHWFVAVEKRCLPKCSLQKPFIVLKKKKKFWIRTFDIPTTVVLTFLFSIKCFSM